MSLIASPQIRLFSFGSVEEKVQGEPRFIRVEKQDFQTTNGDAIRSTTYLYATGEYLPGGLKAQTCIYHPNGTVSSCERYEYDEQGRLSKIRSFSAGVTESQVQNVFWIDPWTEEVVTLNPDGIELERTITKRNEVGTVIESTSISRSEDTQIHLALKQDGHGNFVGGEVLFKAKGEITSRIDLVSQANHRTLIKFYQPNGNVLLQTEITEGNIEESFTQITSQTDEVQKRKIEQIESRDIKGNWTKKAVFERDTATKRDEPTMKLYRSITYY